MEIFRYAFLDEENLVKSVLIFESYDETLLNQVKVKLNADSYKIVYEDGSSEEGDFYNEKYYPQKPYASWVRNEIRGEWISSVPYPTDGKKYTWNEDILNWEEIQESE